MNTTPLVVHYQLEELLLTPVAACLQRVGWVLLNFSKYKSNICVTSAVPERAVPRCGCGSALPQRVAHGLQTHVRSLGAQRSSCSGGYSGSAGRCVTMGSNESGRDVETMLLRQ